MSGRSTPRRRPGRRGSRAPRGTPPALRGASSARSTDRDGAWVEVVGYAWRRRCGRPGPASRMRANCCDSLPPVRRLQQHRQKARDDVGRSSRICWSTVIGRGVPLFTWKRLSSCGRGRRARWHRSWPGLDLDRAFTYTASTSRRCSAAARHSTDSPVRSGDDTAHGIAGDLDQLYVVQRQPGGPEGRGEPVQRHRAPESTPSPPRCGSGGWAPSMSRASPAELSRVRCAARRPT